jgi:argonaute-like protein implicated in RNA metabolism and viral defense
MDETMASIDTAYKNNKEQIESAMFDLALEGIANGRMDYAKDPILPHVIETISKTVEKFSKISQEEQDKMVALSEEQLSAIRNSDVRARDEYILTEPKIDGSLRNNPTVAQVLSSWGK